MSQVHIDFTFDYCENQVARYRWHKYFMDAFNALDNVNFDVSPFYCKFFVKLAEHDYKGYSRVWKFFTSFRDKRWAVYHSLR